VSFQGWPAEALEFYEGLEADNSRTYWLAHKDVYDNQVRAPMVALLAELAAEFGTGHIFRPNRDVRFSNDKSPYKTAIAARLDGGGYVQLSATGLAVGAGMYLMAPDQLERYRQAVDDDKTGEQLRRVVAKLTRREIDVVGRDSLKLAPKGFPKEHPRIDLLRHKGLIAWQEWPVAPWLDTPEPATRIADFLHTCKPLHNWLAEQVGESTLPERER
jgi:uncharacterized protein (TIGR02453 family)